MKKRILSVILSSLILSIAAISISGCDRSSDDNTDNSQINNSQINNSSTTDDNTTVSVFEYEYEENYTYKLDYKYVEDYYFSSFGGEYIELYYDIVDAVINHKSEIEISNSIEDLYYSDNVIKGFLHINPLQSFVTNIERQENVIYIEYRFDEQNHKKELQYMDKRLNEILETNVKEDYTDFERIMAIYTYVSSNFKYDSSYDVESNEKIDIYDFIKNGYGVCHSYARTCKFLIYQYGINTYEARAYSPDGKPHEWFLAQIDDEWYHFDPTYENNDTNGLGLKYFAMSDERRFNNGGFLPQFIAGVSPITTSSPAAIKTNFDVFNNILSYQINSDRMIDAKLTDGKTVTLDYLDYVISNY